MTNRQRYPLFFATTRTGSEGISQVTSCATLIGHKGKVNSMAVQVRAYPSAELLYSASDDNTIRQWDSKVSVYLMEKPQIPF